MAPILYIIGGSPAVRSVFITTKALNLTLEERLVDFLKGEHLQPDYLKMNPLHTMPTLDDNGNILCDSHVINTYLCEKYGKDDSLYPKDLYKRALVDQKMAFDLGLLFPTLRIVDLAYLNGKIKTIQPEMVEEIKTVYDFLETFLKDSEWIALDSFTLADIHCFTTVTCLNYHVNIDEGTYPNIYSWIQRCQNLPYFANDDKEMKTFEKFFTSLKS